MKKPTPKPPTAPRSLDADTLAKVSGGEGTVSPRDPASGLPTGKRM